jgi:phosphate transport system protein
VRHFAEELEELNQALLEMSALVESSLHTAIQSLVEHDDRMARRVIEDEHLINRMELDLDARVTRLLALNQPVAGDLRFLVMCLKINTDLERMGDLAVSIAERAVSLNALRGPAGHPQPLGQALIDTPRMAGLTEDMLHRALDAFVKRDDGLAKGVLPSDDEVDHIRNRVYDDLIALMQREPTLVPAAVHLMFVARNLERIADHATNIAEDVIYMVRGVDVRHHATEP